VNDSDHSFFGLWNSGVQAHRNFAWENFMNGNQAMFMDPYVLYYSRENRNSCSSPNHGICSQPLSRYDNFRDNFGYIVRYSRRLNLAAVLPRSSLCSTGFCLAQTPSIGAEYLVYAPNGGSFTVDLSAMSSNRTLNVEWFNPSTGVTTTASPVPAGSSRTFTPPFQADAVLYLIDSAGHAQTGSSQSAIDEPNSYKVSGLSSGTYRYRVRARDEAGNVGPYSNIVSALVQAGDSTPPSVPGTLGATAESSNQVRLTWGAATDNVTVSGYVLSRCQGSRCSSFSQIGGLITATNYVDSAVSPNTSYTYRVAAVDSASNQGASSNSATVTTPASTATGIALVQIVSVDAGSALSSTHAFPAANSAGNWIGVAVRVWPAGQTVTVSDSRGNTYRQAVHIRETTDGMTLALFYAENVAGGSNSVTVRNSQSGGTLRFAIFEYSGIARLNSLDATASSQGTSGSPSSGGMTTSAAGALVIGLVSTANPRTLTAASGYVVQGRVPATDTKLFILELRQASAGPITASGALNSSDDWAAVAAAFRAAATVPN
jgi:hypothetical protein